METLKSFYAAVAHAGAAFDSSRILQTPCLEGQLATVEPLLSGRPLWTSTDARSPALGDDDIACVTDVLAAFAAIEAAPDMGVLPILDDASRPLAVLDFGFMTTIGDPAFDAAITASIYDMYGPHAAANEAILDEAIADRFGYETSRLALYRAAYALTTSNCFSASDSDGHFEWCLRLLDRLDVREALDL